MGPGVFSGYHKCSLRNITLVAGKRGSGILGIVRVKAMRNTVYKLAHICAFYTGHSAGHQPEKQWGSEWEKEFRKR